MKLLVHACCGPCAIMPLCLLGQEGHSMAVHYENPNIAPQAEYAHRRDVLCAYVRDLGLPFSEGTYEPAAWEQHVGALGAAAENGEDGIKREDRCRACYRLRLERSAAFAASNGFDALTTTLAVSPYQLRDVMHEELDRACEAAALKPVFRDFTPFYKEATRISRALGMYRQNYCGCRFSVQEAEQTRELLRRKRAEQKKIRAAAQAERDEERAVLAARKRAYEEQRARKRAILKALRADKERPEHEDR